MPVSLDELNQIIKDHYPEFKGIHPAANIFPMSSEDEFNSLVQDIKSHGLVHDIARTEDHYLVDGRNRLLACYLVGQDIRVKTIYGDPVRIALSENLHRRHLSAGQKAMIGDKVRDIFDQQAKERQKESGRFAGRDKNGNPKTQVQEKIPEPEAKQQPTPKEKPANQKLKPKPEKPAPQARDLAAKAVGTNGKYLDMARDINQYRPDLAPKVEQGGMRLADAHKEAKKEKKKVIQFSEAKPKPESPRIKVFSDDGKSAEISQPKKPVFNVTNDSVDWASHTWNPVTGCRHGCKFCYANEIANSKRMKEFYPLGFTPTFHDYRLDAPKNTKLSGNGRVFVCSMADLFGKWVPDEWIRKVFEACQTNPVWTYMFLTKWPARYKMLSGLPKAWFGASVIKQADVARIERDMTSFETPGLKWISLEPMLQPIKFNDLSWCDVIVIGSQTSANGQPAIAAHYDWVFDVVAQCRQFGVQYYLKPNLEKNPGMVYPRNLPDLKII